MPQEAYLMDEKTIQKRINHNRIGLYVLSFIVLGVLIVSILGIIKASDVSSNSNSTPSSSASISSNFLSTSNNNVNQNQSQLNSSSSSTGTNFSDLKTFINDLELKLNETKLRLSNPDCSFYLVQMKQQSTSNINNNNNNNTNQLLVSGIYSHPVTQKPIYCEFNFFDSNTIQAGWTLLSTFEQPKGKHMADFPIDEYKSLCNNNQIWINGHADGLPISPEPVNSANFNILSHNWKDMLVFGQKYQLRQRFFKGSGVNKHHIFDVAYTFTYNGHVTQDESNIVEDRAWALTNRRILFDGTGIKWDINPPASSGKTEALFWLPFTSNAYGPVYSGCGSYDLAVNSCSATTETARRYGNAGIAGMQQDGNDVAASWSPHFNSCPNCDIVWVHQDTSAYGMQTTVESIFLSYWIRKL